MLGVALLAGEEAATQLKAKADAAHGADQAKLCLEYARLELESSGSSASGRPKTAKTCCSVIPC